MRSLPLSDSQLDYSQLPQCRNVLRQLETTTLATSKVQPLEGKSDGKYVVAFQTTLIAAWIEILVMTHQSTIQIPDEYAHRQVPVGPHSTLQPPFDLLQLLALPYDS
jgi:hypothetical protein